MRTLSLFFALIAAGASAGLHAWLFAPAASQPPPPPPPDPEPESREESPAVVVEPGPPPAHAVPPPTDALPEPDGARAVGEPREDLSVEFEVDDEAAVLALGARLGLPLMLVAEETRQAWPVRIETDGRLEAGEVSGTGQRAFLLLPERDERGRRNRFAHWGSLARSRLRVPPQLPTSLALELRDDALHRAAREALRRYCAAQGIAVQEVRRVVVRSALANGVADLAVAKVVLP